MLQAIRDRVTGIVAWAIVILISVPFALWGIQEYFGAASSVAVATVDGEEVSLRRYQRYYQRQRAQLSRVLGGASVPRALEEGVRERALEQLIGEEVVLRGGLDDGLSIGDQQLASAIQGDPGFQIDGAFSQQAYQQYIRSQNFTSAGFEQEIRRDMLLRQISQGLSAGSLVTRTELDRLSRLRSQARTAKLMAVPKERFADVDITEQQINEYYDANREEFKTPEKVDVEYLEIARQSVADGISVDDADVEARYEQSKSNYTQAEQREASHILVRVAADAADAEVAQAREKIEAIAEELAGGADFEALAEAKSEDLGSARRGGSLGQFGLGIMDPAFEEAAFALEVGTVSEPVRSKSGFHLIRVDRIDKEQLQSLESVRGSLRAQMQMELAESEYFDRVEQLATLGFEQSGSLEAASDALGIAPVRLDGLTREPTDELDELAGDARFVAAAFSNEVLEGGNNSELFEVEGERSIVLRVVDRHPARDRPLEDVRDSIEERLTEEAARAGAAKLGRQAVASLRAGEAPEKVASDLSLEWGDAQALDRQSAAADAKVLEHVLKMPLPADAEGPAYDGIAAHDGSFAVIELAGLAPAAEAGDPAEDTLSAERERLELSMPGALGQGEFDAYMAALRAGTDVVVNEETLQ